MNIDTQLVARLIGKQFPKWASLDVVQVLPGGWDNRTFRLGDDKLVRLPSAECYADKVEKEQYWLPILKKQLSLDIPVPLAKGAPTQEFPWPWSVYQWIEGDTAFDVSGLDKVQFAKDLADFLLSLQALDASNGPLAGEDTFYRGCSPCVYDSGVCEALELLEGDIDIVKAGAIWQAAIKTHWEKPSVWVHGDVSAGNILVREGRLSAVIDFGGICVGDPACDLAIAWSFLDEGSRKVFKSHLAVDEATWLRGKAWALWKALIVEAGMTDSNSLEKMLSHRTIEAVLNG